MDFVTHAAVGAIVGRALAPAGAEGSLAARAAGIGALVALVPDADHVLELVSAEAYFVWHRTLTHGVPFAAVVTGLAALEPGGPPPGLARGRRALIAGGALASHLALDTLTPFGTALLWPFDRKLFALDGLPIVAPWFLGLAVVAFVAAALGGRRAAIAALGALALFAGVEVAVARRGARAIAAASGAPVALAHPRVLHPLEAEAFVVDGDRVQWFRAGLVPGTGPPRLVETCPRVTAGDDARARVAALAARPDVAALLGRLRVPVAEVAPDGQVTWLDFQFATMAPRERWPIRVIAGAPAATGGAASSGAASVRVEQKPLGVQLFLWLAILGATALIARRFSGARGARKPGALAWAGFLLAGDALLWLATAAVAARMPAAGVVLGAGALSLLAGALIYVWAGLGANPGPVLRTERAVWLWPVLLSYRLGAWLVWRAVRHLRGEPPLAEVASGLFVGARLRADEAPLLDEHRIAAVVDLAAELPPSKAIARARERVAYLAVPALDRTPPADAELDAAAGWIRDSLAARRPVLVHCAYGHGRSALVVAAALLAAGLEPAPDAAIARVRRARPTTNLLPDHLRALARFHARRAAAGGAVGAGVLVPAAAGGDATNRETPAS